MIINFLIIIQDRYTIIAGGTSRNICKAICQPLLETDGLTLGGPI